MTGGGRQSGGLTASRPSVVAARRRRQSSRSSSTSRFLGPDCTSGTPQVWPNDGRIRGRPQPFRGSGLRRRDQRVPLFGTAALASGPAPASRPRAPEIDAWLRSAAAVSFPKHEQATCDELHFWYFGDNARRQQPELPAEGNTRRQPRGLRTRDKTRTAIRSSADVTAP